MPTIRAESDALYKWRMPRRACRIPPFPPAVTGRGGRLSSAFVVLQSRQTCVPEQ
jgi:hypothetical protein